MDAFTLTLATLIVSGLMSISLFVLYSTGNKAPYLINWIIAGILSAISSYSGLQIILGNQYSMELIAFTNATYVAMHLAILSGVRRMNSMSSQWLPIIGFSVMILVSHFIPGLLTTTTDRILFLFPIIMLVNLGAVWLLLRSQNVKIKFEYLPFFVAELIFFLQLLVRFLIVCFDTDWAKTVLGGEILNVSGSLSLLVFISLVTITACLVIFKQQDSALNK